MSIKTDAELIRDETVDGANTATRVGSNLVAIADDLIAKQTAIDGVLTDVETIDFDTTYISTGTEPEGTIYWDDTDKTLTLVQDGTKLQLGQELHVRVRNDQGAILTNGSVVYISGRTGVFPNVKLARSDAQATSTVLGIVTEDIAVGGFGFVTELGYVRGLKTDYTGAGVWGTTWVEGDQLYVSSTTAGQLTNVPPDVPNFSDVVGTVGVLSATQGTILVILNRHKSLVNLSDVNGTPLTTNGQLMLWDNDNGYFDFTANINDYALAATNTGDQTLSIAGQDLTISGVNGNTITIPSGSGSLSVTSITGWADYSDTQYTDVSPFSVIANTDTNLPNNAGLIRDTEKPTDITSFYSGGLISGNNGDSYALTIEMTVVPTSAGTTFIEAWIDIGGGITDLYRRPFTFPKGTGIARPITFTTGIYTLDTWEANGGTVKVRANGSADIYDVRYVFYRLHKAGNGYTTDNAITSDNYAALINSTTPTELNPYITSVDIDTLAALNTRVSDATLLDQGNIFKLDSNSPIDLFAWAGTQAEFDAQFPTGAPANYFYIITDGVASLIEADNVVYDNTTSGLTATTVQASIDEVEARVDVNDAKVGVTTEISNVVEDTTPQLGGDLDLNGNTILDLPTEIQVAISDETSDLTVGTSKLTFRMPYAMTLSEVRASVNTAPTGANLVIDVNEGGVSIFSTTLSIDATEKTSTTATTPAVISDTALADDAEITIDIDQIGSTIAGAGAKVTFIGTRA